MNLFVYALVPVPSLRELLPRSGYSGYQGQRRIVRRVALRPVPHWLGNSAFLWGPIEDKFGRVRTLMLTILWYSAFTF